MNLYKKCTGKKCYSLVIDVTLALDNLSCLRKNLLEKTGKLLMTIDNNIRDETLQYDINREAGKLLTISSGKIHKYEYLTGEEILPFN